MMILLSYQYAFFLSRGKILKYFSPWVMGLLSLMKLHLLWSRPFESRTQTVEDVFGPNGSKEFQPEALGLTLSGALYTVLKG
jgi:hypothetical protein